MMPLPPRHLLPVPLPTPFRPGDPRHLDPLGLHIRDTSDPHKVRDLLVAIDVLRRDGEAYVPYLPMKADLVNGKVPASQLPEGQQGVTDVLVDNVSVVTDGTARIDLSGKVDKEQGKGLSSNDYTTEEKTKLSGIETGAQRNVGEVYTTEEKTKLGNVEAGAQRNVTPVTPSTDASAAGKPADAKATGDALAGKQATILDLAAIRDHALTAVQSVNGVTPTDGEVTITGANIETTSGSGYSVLDAILTITQDVYDVAANLRYAIDSLARDPDPETGAYQLDDRTINYIQTSATAIVVALPAARTDGRARDFFVRLTSLAATGADNVSIAFADPDIVVLTPGAEMPQTPLDAETILYFSEIGPNEFLLKGETVEVTPQGGD